MGLLCLRRRAGNPSLSGKVEVRLRTARAADIAELIGRLAAC
jgi:hypothetical protein